MELRTNPRKTEKALAAEKQEDEMNSRKSRSGTSKKFTQSVPMRENGTVIAEGIPDHREHGRTSIDATKSIGVDRAPKPARDPTTLTQIVSLSRSGINVE